MGVQGRARAGACAGVRAHAVVGWGARATARRRRAGGQRGSGAQAGGGGAQGGAGWAGDWGRVASWASMVGFRLKALPGASAAAPDKEFLFFFY